MCALVQNCVGSPPHAHLVFAGRPAAAAAAAARPFADVRGGCALQVHSRAPWLPRSPSCSTRHAVEHAGCRILLPLLFPPSPRPRRPPVPGLAPTCPRAALLIVALLPAIKTDPAFLRVRAAWEIAVASLGPSGTQGHGSSSCSCPLRRRYRAPCTQAVHLILPDATRSFCLQALWPSPSQFRTRTVPALSPLQSYSRPLLPMAPSL